MRLKFPPNCSLLSVSPSPRQAKKVPEKEAVSVLVFLLLAH